MWRIVLLVVCVSHLPNAVYSTFIERTWTYQSTIRVNSMGMEGSSFAMHGRGITTIAQGTDLIYRTQVSGSDTPFPSTVWVGSCVYETDYDGFVRCVNRKAPIYHTGSNLPVCTLDPVRTNLNPDEYCDGPGEPAPYYIYSAPTPLAPGSVADNVGDQYGAHVSLAGDLEFGSILAVGAPKTYESPATFYESFGAVYMHTGEYKRWTETQRLVPNDSNLGLTANRPDFGKIVELDKATSRNLLVSCPQCVSVSTTEGAVYVYKTSNGKTWSSTQQLISDDATTSDFEFGKNVKIHDEFALIAAAGLNTRGALYIFREERHSIYKDGVYNGQWTQQQKLVPHDAYIRGAGEYWGTKADLHGKTLVVGQSTEPTYGTNTGAAYVYKSSTTMELPHNHWDFTGRRLDGDNHPKPKPIPMHKWWSQVQKLYPSDPHVYRLFGDEVAIWGDAIAVSGAGESLNDGLWDGAPAGTNYQFGSVYMFSREDFNTDAWTQQQKLYNPDANDGSLFVNSVDDNYQNNALTTLANNNFGVPRLYGSSLTVTSDGDTPYAAYTYFMTDNVDWNCLLITVGDGMGDGWDRARLVVTAPDGPTHEVRTDTFSQFCDAYNYNANDETIPESRKFHETYRYCPLDGHNAGDYHFEIMGNPRGKKGDKGTPSDDLYWREIYWDVYNELDKKRYIGDAHTKMTFNWGKKDFFFTMKTNSHLWKPEAQCTQCNQWKGLNKEGQKQPKPKPSSKKTVRSVGVDEESENVNRRLNTYPTPAPTNTLAPTLAYDTNAYSVDQWMFVMGRNFTSGDRYGSTIKWDSPFNNGTQTMFYIYDSNGLNITEPLIWGQLCTLTGSIRDSCTTHDLPVGGTYTLRVTGGMDYRRNDIQWKFCNIDGLAQQTLVFTKYSTTCLPLAHYNSDDMCEKNGFQVFADGTIVLKGLAGLYSEERDTAIVEAALKTMLHPYVASNINIDVVQEALQSGSAEDVVIRAEFQFDSNLNKISVTDLDGLHNFETALVEKLGYYDDNNLMASMLSSAAHDLLGSSHTVMSGTSFESHVTDIEIVKAELNPNKIIRDRVHTTVDASEGTVHQETSTETETSTVKMDHATQLEYNLLNAEAIGGYVVLASAVMAVVLVALVTWHQASKSKRKGEQKEMLLDLEGAGMGSVDNSDHVDWKAPSSSSKKKKTKGTRPTM